jgi:hypothetical protein
MSYEVLLSDGFNGQVKLRQKRPGVMKLLLPMFHEDGDMLDIFLQTLPDGRIRVSDHGLTLMRLSYGYDIDTGNKERIFRRILRENQVADDAGNLHLDVEPAQLYAAVLHFGQTVAKVCNMGLYRREVIANLFYEEFRGLVDDAFAPVEPRADFVPLENRAELVVDFALGTERPKPVFLFGVKARETAKLRLVAVACLEFARLKVPFSSVVVHQDFEGLSQGDRSIITNAADKQFTTLEQFKELGRPAIDRLM